MKSLAVASSTASPSPTKHGCRLPARAELRGAKRKCRQYAKAEGCPLVGPLAAESVATPTARRLFIYSSNLVKKRTFCIKRRKSIHSVIFVTMNPFLSFAVYTSDKTTHFPLAFRQEAFLRIAFVCFLIPTEPIGFCSTCSFSNAPLSTAHHPKRKGTHTFSPQNTPPPSFLSPLATHSITQSQHTTFLFCSSLLEPRRIRTSLNSPKSKETTKWPHPPPTRAMTSISK